MVEPITHSRSGIPFADLAVSVNDGSGVPITLQRAGLSFCRLVGTTVQDLPTPLTLQRFGLTFSRLTVEAVYDRDGTVDVQLQELVLAATSNVIVGATVDQALADVRVASAGAVAIAAAGVARFDGMTSAADGAVAIVGGISVRATGDSLAASLAVAVDGQADIGLKPLRLTTVAGPVVGAQVSVTTADMKSAAAGMVAVRARGVARDESTIVEANGTVETTGTLSRRLQGDTVSATATNEVIATSSIDLRATRVLAIAGTVTGVAVDELLQDIQARSAGVVRVAASVAGRFESMTGDLTTAVAVTATAAMRADRVLVESLASTGIDATLDRELQRVRSVSLATVATTGEVDSLAHDARLTATVANRVRAIGVPLAEGLQVEATAGAIVTATASIRADRLTSDAAGTVATVSAFDVTLSVLRVRSTATTEIETATDIPLPDMRATGAGVVKTVARVAGLLPLGVLATATVQGSGFNPFRSRAFHSPAFIRPVMRSA